MTPPTSRSFFGTDGIRGTANTHPMTAEVAMKVGMAAGVEMTRGQHQHRVVIGKDTRLSGYMLEQALTAGFLSVGMNVILVGPMPTPAVAMLTPSLRADLGVMISASHNHYQDNGIKLFDHNGLKLSDELEAAIERHLTNPDFIPPLAASGALGRAKRLDDAPGRYIEFVKNTFPKEQRLDGLKIVIDCANGAAYHLGKTILWELGAEVIELGVNPNGFNINEECGSTHPLALCAEVVAQGADLGIALDGDADRVVLCDEKGKVVDGDQLLALIATCWQKRGRLKGKGIVATQMSNLGLEHYLRGLGLGLERTQVGDRYVAEAMRSKGYNIGGEQSGHIILSDYSTTGDGLIGALQVLVALVENGRKRASELCHLFDPLPQLLRNVKYPQGVNPLQDDKVQSAIRHAEKTLGSRGRVLIRKSGTEPLIRVMAEGENADQVGRVVSEIVGEIERTVG